MVVEDERDVPGLDSNYLFDSFEAPAQGALQHMSSAQFCDAVERVRDQDAHLDLRNELIEHIWKLRGARH